MLLGTSILFRAGAGAASGLLPLDESGRKIGFCGGTGRQRMFRITRLPE
jgi:hypothetical protein